MTLPAEEKARKRNEILKQFNELQKKRKYLEASIILEEAVKISKELGEIDKANAYSQKIEECIEAIKAIDDEIQVTRSDPELKVELADERNKLVTSAQKAVENNQIQEACDTYRRAVDLCLKIEDKTAFWKLSKIISLLEQKTGPLQKDIKPESPVVTGSTVVKSQPSIIESSAIKAPVIKAPLEVKAPPVIKAAPIVKESPVIKVQEPNIPSVKKVVPFSQPAPELKPQEPLASAVKKEVPFSQTFPEIKTPEASPSTVKKEVPFSRAPTENQQPIPAASTKPSTTTPDKKEIPFFNATIEEQGPKLTEKIDETAGKPKPEKEDKKITKKFDEEEKRVQKKLEEAEKKFHKETEKGEKQKEKEEKQKEKEGKKKEESETKKGKEEKAPPKFQSGLPTDLLSEIRSFKHDELETKPAEKGEKKKPAGSQSILPSDVLEELKKKTVKKSK